MCDIYDFVHALDQNIMIGRTVKRYGVGEMPDSWHAGDYLLAHHQGAIPALIRFGQRLRFRGERRQYAYWNHAVWVSSDCLYEAEATGISETAFDAYRDVDFHYVTSNLTDEERSDGDVFVRWAYDQHGSYGFVTIVSIGLSLLTGLKLNFGVPGTVICSGLVAAGLAAPQWREDPSHVMPADLAEYAAITP